MWIQLRTGSTSTTSHSTRRRRRRRWVWRLLPSGGQTWNGHRRERGHSSRPINMSYNVRNVQRHRMSTTCVIVHHEMCEEFSQVASELFNSEYMSMIMSWRIFVAWWTLNCDTFMLIWCCFRTDIRLAPALYAALKVWSIIPGSGIYFPSTH